MTSIVMKAEIPGLTPFASGKVRDIFDLGNALLIVTSDRISAFDVVTPHGITLPGGLQESDRLPEPIFTPATKATTGHDENIGMKEMRQIVGPDDAAELARISLSLYRMAAERALRNGIIIADTKFEF